MKMVKVSSGILLLCVATLVLPSIGCGNKKKTAPPTKATHTHDKDTGHTHAPTGEAKEKKNDPAAKPETWWCLEHGVPEHLCSLCLPEKDVKTMFKDKGDWCKDHDRAKSQCFKCEPELYKKHEAMYVAQFNKKPAPPPKEEFEK